MLTKVSRRGVRGGKRLDTNQLRELIAKTPMVTSLGVVRKFPGETSHFEVNTENGTREILVDVELIPSGERVQCRLGFGNDGVYRIPRVNTEVAVLIPFNPQSLIKDSLDYEPIIVGVLDVNAPPELNSDDVVFIKAGTVIAGDATAAFLALKSDVDDIKTWLATHTHSGVTAGVAVTAVPVEAASLPTAVGTTKLKGK